MAEEFQIGGGNRWNSWRARFEGRATPSSSSALNSTGSFGWPTEIVDLNFKARSSNSMNSVSASISNDSLLFQNTQNLTEDPNLQIMGLGLSPHPMDWNQTSSFRGSGKAMTSYRSGLQQNMSSAGNFQQEIGIESWRQKLYPSNPEANEYKQFSPNISSSFQTDPAAYGSPSSTVTSQQPNFLYPTNYGSSYPGELLPSYSKVELQQQQQQKISLLQVSSNAPSWNTTSASVNDVRSSNFFPPPTFDEKPKNKPEVRDLGKVTKKSSSEASNKRSRSETPSTSPLPPFKVRKEKMGDRITALQQLVSPFGKTDTASVLSEAIEYIKFLHERVNVLSNPYMRSGAPMQHHLSFDKSKDCEGPTQNLRSRGLCLVPISSTFPVTYETPADFWTPTYGATFR